MQIPVQINVVVSWHLHCVFVSMQIKMVSQLRVPLVGGDIKAVSNVNKKDLNGCNTEVNESY